VGVDIQADNSISGNAKDINIQNANNTDTNYSSLELVVVVSSAALMLTLLLAVRLRWQSLIYPSNSHD
jgi:hypothetical protein